jgi:hypothetical protein
MILGFSGEISVGFPKLFLHLEGILGRGAARRKACTYIAQHNTENHVHTSMPRVGFEPFVPQFERARPTPWTGPL